MALRIASQLGLTILHVSSTYLKPSTPAKFQLFSGNANRSFGSISEQQHKFTIRETSYNQTLGA